MTLKKSNDVESEHSSPPSPSKIVSSSSSETKTYEVNHMLVRCIIDQVQNELEPTQRELFFSNKMHN